MNLRWLLSDFILKYIINDTIIRIRTNIGLIAWTNTYYIADMWYASSCIVEDMTCNDVTFGRTPVYILLVFSVLLKALSTVNYNVFNLLMKWNGFIFCYTYFISVACAPSLLDLYNFAGWYHWRNYCDDIGWYHQVSKKSLSSFSCLKSCKMIVKK